MTNTTRIHFDNLHSSDATIRYQSFQWIMDLTQQPVEWAYEVWDELLSLMKQGDNHQRTIAVQVLSNLAKSDPGWRMLTDLGKLMHVTEDEKFVTARHSLQCLWKIGIVGKDSAAMLLSALAKRFKECATEKNCTLMRYDIIVVIRKVFDILKDKKLQETAIALIQTEPDEKYRKKYLGIWKDLLKAK